MIDRCKRYKRNIKGMKKFARLLMNKKYRNALFHGVAAGIEHELVIKSLNVKTIVDIGANKGQFAMVSKGICENALIFSFEPLPEPATIFRKVHGDDSAIILYNAAIGPKKQSSKMHVSASDDSSSLLPISDLQEEIFPGTAEVGTIEVNVAPLDLFINESDLIKPSLLKLDVQGFEFDALRGCESLLHKFEWVYCECSFVELYSDQKMAADIIEWLGNKGFRLKGIYNTTYDAAGLAIQADFLFENSANT